MKILVFMLLSLPLVLFGCNHMQGRGMEKTDGAMGMSPGMPADKMAGAEQKMSSGDMTDTDGMMDSEQKIPSGDMMESNGMKGSDETMKEQTMMPQIDGRVPSDAVLRERLTPLQYRVTREEGTEPAFNNAYWDNHEAGIYVDVISGVPLFSSTDKYDSGTGWPSFTRPLEPEQVVIREDRSFFMVRNEVRSKLSDAHLGHVFDDGPEPTGRRYCMNSAALRFVPAADLDRQGYGEYAALFK